nr:GAK system XXXCH domain-containing protein [Candidatus Brocadiales bacterium]
VTINEETCSIAADTEVKISLKAKGDTFSSKLKFNLANPLSKAVEEEGESTVTGDESYMDLKRRMSKDFKAIKNSCIQEQVLPETDLVERFYRDSKTMCTYPSKGKDFFETYLEQAALFYEAFKTSDLKAMSAAVTALGQIRKDCHNKHK